jgi:hypothetical protein
LELLVISGSGLIGASIGTGGVTIDDNSRGKRLFRITSGSNPYTAAEVVLDESDGSRDVTGVYDVTAAQKVLWEVNGNTSVPANTVVEATPNPSGLGFYFTGPAAGPAAAFHQSALTTSTVTIGSSPTTILSVTVSAAGTYLLSYSLTSILTHTAGGYILSQVPTYLAATAISNLLQSSSTSVETVSDSGIVTGVTAGAVIELKAAWAGTGGSPTLAKAIGAASAVDPVIGAASATPSTLYPTRLTALKLY